MATNYLLGLFLKHYGDSETKGFSYTKKVEDDKDLAKVGLPEESNFFFIDN